MDVFNGGVIGTQNVIDAINASGSVRRLLYTSSMAAVRGSRHTRRKAPADYEWTETDWAYEGIEPEVWESPRNAYARSKVETERLVNAAADESGGKWDAITMAPAMICGPILFKAQVGQWDRTARTPRRRPAHRMAIQVRHVLRHHRCPRPGQGRTPGGGVHRRPRGNRGAVPAT